MKQFQPIEYSKKKKKELGNRAMECIFNLDYCQEQKVKGQTFALETMRSMSCKNAEQVM